MIGFSLYFLVAAGLALLLTTAFRRLRHEDDQIATPEEDAAFDRRIAEIEARFGPYDRSRPGEQGK